MKLSQALKSPVVDNKKVTVNIWQDNALTFAKKLNITPCPMWFRAFKNSFDNYKEGKIDKAYRYLVDHPNRYTMTPDHKKRLFLKLYYSKK